MDVVSSDSSAWASLPKELLDLVLNNLVQLSDYVRFSAVCKTWLSVALRQKQRRIRENFHNQVPLLLIATKDRSHERRSLYSVTQNKTYNTQLMVPYDRRCCGSSHGWLATVEENLGITLINPFSAGKTKPTIRLPPVSAPPRRGIFSKRDPFKYEYYALKVILSGDPSLTPDDYVIVALHRKLRNQLAYIKPGYKSWIPIDEELFVDVIYHKGQIYVVDYFGAVTSVDISSNPPRLTVVVPRTLEQASMAYIVESSEGDLLLVQRFLAEKDHAIQWVTSKFQVFKLLGPSGQGLSQWVEINSLGDDALFLGDNYSQSVSASDFPGCQPNCIYYTDDYIDITPYFPFGPRDSGIYNLEDGSFGLHYKLKPKHKRMPPPIWIVPKLQ